MKRAAQLIDSVCKQNQVSIMALKSGSRIPEVTQKGVKKSKYN